MKKLIILIGILALTLGLFATEVVIGDGTATQRFPLGSFYGYERSAALYTAAEIGPQNTRISAVAWNSSIATTAEVPTKIYMKTSSASTLTTDTWDNMISGAVLLYDSPYTGTVAGGWNLFTLINEFNVDMGDNLMILVERNYGGSGSSTPGGSSAGGGIYATPLTGTHLTWNADTNPPTGTGVVNANRPNVTITYTTYAIDTPPFPAAVISPADGATLVSPSATLNWGSGGGGPTGYKVHFGITNPPPFIQNTTAISYTPTLAIGTTYYWKIIPFNAIGDAVDCPVWSFSTHGDPEIVALPYFQNWDLVTAPILPFDWTNIVQSSNVGALVATYASATYAHSQPNSVRLYNPSDADATLILVGPTIAPAIGLSNVRVKFWGRSSGAGYPLSLGVMTDPTDPASYTEVHNLAMTTTISEYVFSMAGYTGAGTHIAFKHGLGGTSRSLYLDDLSFEQIAPNDLACERLSGNTTPALDSPTVYTASIHNWGTATQSTYTVKLFNGDNVELASVPGATVAPDATAQIAMTWTPTVEGTIVLYAKVFLTGDINPVNDQSPDLSVLVMGAGTDVISIGNDTTTNTTTGPPTPYGTYYKNFRQQYLWTAAEILASGGAPGMLTSISFNVQAVNTCSPMPNYRIRVKNTQQSVLTTTFEVGDYTQVWAQNDFLPVAGWNTHPFTTPFYWDGTSNLLVDIVTSLIPGAYSQNASVYYTATTGVNTCLRYQNDTADAASGTTGTLSVNRANVRISLNVVGMGALTGTVTSGGNPVSGASVAILGTTHTVQTDALGAYNFPYVEPGTYNVTASKVGFESLTLPVTLVVDETSTLNFVLTASSSVNVTGFVVGSDQPTVGLAEASVTLVGLVNYSATTDATGHFTIPGVLSGNDYNYIISQEGYEDLTGSITVGSAAYDMGTLILPEISFPPSQVVATENVAQTQVSLIWNAPVPTPPLDDFELNDGGWVPTATWDAVGDWEWTNTYDIANWAPVNPGTNINPPPTCYSGTGMWGTMMYTNYHNSGGFNNLSKNYSLAGLTSPELRFWSWENVFGDFDYCQITVNGAVVWGPSWLYTNTVWTERVIDLSAYAGMADVEIQLQMWATTVVDYAGWYIDDVYVGNALTREVVSAPAITPAIFNGMDEMQASLAAEQQAQNHPVSRPQHRSQDRVRTGYKVWRLLAANEGNETLWNQLTPTTIADSTFVDTAWAPLPSGIYKYAVKAVYTNDVFSTAAFSNEIHKGMMGTLTGAVTEFGTNVPVAGATVTAGDYHGTTGANGQYTFLVYQGTYSVTCAKPGYQPSTVTGVVIAGTQTTTQNFVLTEITLPPGSVTASVAGPAVNLTWSPPGTAGGEWIHYNTGVPNNSIGLTSGGDFDVAIRFPASALQDYAGMSLQAIKLWPADPATYTLKVWTGGNATAPGPQAVTQPFTVTTYDEWLTVNLDSPVSITGNEELWFGYNVVHVADYHPAGCDPGPAVDGFGNMIFNSGAWSTLLALSASLNYNWAVQGYAGYSAPADAPLLSPVVSNITAPAGIPRYAGIFSVRTDSPRPASTIPETHTKSLAPAQYNADRFGRSLNGYKAWRLQQGQENNESSWTELTPEAITATAYADNGWNDLPDGTYKWAVKAVYTGNAMSVAAFSNPLTMITQIGTIAGIVRTTANAPIMGATVSCGTVNATTNASGAYSMQVEAGTHSVTASHPNYQAVTQAGVIVVTGQTTTLNFQLPISQDILVDGFETYPNFVIAFAPWTLVDVDLSTTFGMTGTAWDNAYAAQAFIIMNPTATVPPIADAGATPHGGSKYAASFAATTAPNNDWMITPVLANPVEIKLWAKSFTAQYGLERMKVGVSTTGMAPANFTIISGATHINVPAEWTEYSYSLAGYPGNVYVGIQCLSNDAFFLMIDDVRISGGTANEDPNVPVVATELHGNFPNPFNPETTIRYSVKEASPVSIEIYNVKGQLVKTLVNENKASGNYSVVWNGRDNNQQAVSSGVYFYKMFAGKYSSTKKMILMK